MAVQEGVHYAIFIDQGAGVGLRRRHAAGAAPSLEHDDGNPLAARLRGRRRQHFGILQALHVKHDQLDRRVFGDNLCQLRYGRVGLVAGRQYITHAYPPLAQQGVQGGAGGTALADDSHRPVLRCQLREHRAEVGHGAVAEVGETLRVGADQAHPGARSHLGQFGLLLEAVFTGFAKAGTKNDGRAHASGGAGAHRGCHRGAGYRHDGKIGRLRQRGHIGVARQALHHAAGGIDRVDIAGIAETPEVVDGPATHLVRIIRCADNGNGLRCQCGSERVGSGIHMHC